MSTKRNVLKIKLIKKGDTGIIINAFPTPVHPEVT